MLNTLAPMMTPATKAVHDSPRIRLGVSIARCAGARARHSPMLTSVPMTNPLPMSAPQSLRWRIFCIPIAVARRIGSERQPDARSDEHHSEDGGLGQVYNRRHEAVRSVPDRGPDARSENKQRDDTGGVYGRLDILGGDRDAHPRRIPAHEGQVRPPS